MEKLEFVDDDTIRTDFYWLGKCKTENQVIRMAIREAMQRFNKIIETVYLIEEQIYSNNAGEVCGKLEFSSVSETFAKSDEYYVPLISCVGYDGILNVDIRFEIELMRHHPTKLVIRWEDNFWICNAANTVKVDIIDFMDDLHMEETSHHKEILNLANKRIKQFLKTYGKFELDDEKTIRKEFKVKDLEERTKK